MRRNAFAFSFDPFVSASRDGLASRAWAFCRSGAAFLFVALFLAGCSTSSTLDVASPRFPPLPAVGSDDKYAALVVDAGSGQLMYQVNADLERYPASLTKMMTLYLLFEALDSGRVAMDTPIPVSSHAASQEPSKLWLKPGATIDVDSAIRALTVKSANDVSVAVAELIGGTEDRFCAMMTAKARSLGMRGTVFVNANGLPDARQRTTARDMAVLGMSLRKRFPQYYPYFSQTSFAFGGRTITGHNRLLGRVAGVDGIKTGYVRASGFNIVTSVRADGRSLVVVVLGGSTARARDAQVEALIAQYLPYARRTGALTQ